MFIVGQSVTWREAIITRSPRGHTLIGERVICGTIRRERKSRGGTTDFHINVQTVEGYQAETVGASVWVKRSKLAKGMSWQRAKTKLRPSKPNRR